MKCWNIFFHEDSEFFSLIFCLRHNSKVSFAENLLAKWKLWKEEIILFPVWCFPSSPRIFCCNFSKSESLNSYWKTFFSPFLVGVGGWKKTIFLHCKSSEHHLKLFSWNNKSKNFIIEQLCRRKTPKSFCGWFCHKLSVVLRARKRKISMFN